MRHTDILFFTLVDTVLHTVACVRSWKAKVIAADYIFNYSSLYYSIANATASSKKNKIK